MSFVTDFLFGSDDAADAAEDAANVQASAQREALDYLKEREQVPQYLREQALGQLGGIYGLYGEGGAPAPGTPATGTGDYGVAPPPTAATTSTMDRFIELQNQLALANKTNETMSEKMRDNQGLKRTSHLEAEIDKIRRENPTVVFPPMPTAYSYYDYSMGGGASKPTLGNVDYSQYYGQLPDETVTPAPGAPGAPGASGAPGTTEGDGYGTQQDLIDRAMNSPLYQQIMGGQELGEEAIMRQAGATGGLRSGNVQGNMYDYITQLQNQALLSSYNEQLQGLQGLAGLPSNANTIAGGMQGIGQTQAQGITAGAQATAAGNQGLMNNLLNIGGLGLQAYGLGMFSDRRLKKNIVKLGQINGHNFYSFDWNLLANELGLTGNTCGCMADEVFKKNPEAVCLKDGFMMVEYSMIGVL